MNDFIFTAKLLTSSLKAKANLRKSSEQIKNLQQKAFTKLVNYTYLHSKFYQRIIDQNKIDLTNPRLADFPIIDKNTILKNFNDLVTDSEITKQKVEEYLTKPLTDNSLFLDKYTVVNTSGSSGTVGYFVYSQDELARGLCYSSIANGIALNQKLAFIGATKGRFAGISMIKSAKKVKFMYKDILVLDINDPLEEILDKLNDFGPTVVVAYSSFLPIIAKEQENGRLHISPKKINSSGEAISAENKKYVEKVFQTSIVNIYACSEHLIMGVGKDEYGGMHLMEDNFLFELNPSTTLVTNLYNYTIPMIRYEMNDIFTPIVDPEPSIPYTKIANLVARQENGLKLLNRDGVLDFIHPIPLIGLFSKGVKRYQFVVKDQTNFLVKIVLDTQNKPQTDEIIKNFDKKLQEIIAQKNMQNVVYDYQVVDTLPNDPKTGKFKLVT